MLRPHEFQPCNVFFELEIGGLKSIYIEPDIPIDCSVVISQDNSYGNVTLTLFDDIALEIESAIWTASGGSAVPEGKFSFGYTNGPAEAKSEIFIFHLNEYSISVGQNFFTFTMTGILNGVSPVISGTKLDGTLPEVIKQYAEAHDMEVTIQPPFSSDLMKVVDKKGLTTTYKENVHVRQNNEKDFQFLQRIVRQHAIDGEGVGRYTVANKTEDGVKKLIIQNPNAANVSERYVVQDPDSVVIEWTPEISMSILGGTGGADLSVLSTASFTGDEQAHMYNDHITKKPDIGENGHTQLTRKEEENYKISKQFANSVEPQMRNSETIKAQAGGTGEPTELFNTGLNYFLDKNMMKNTATLVVEGDPRVVVGSIIEVIYYHPSSMNKTKMNQVFGKEHYTSGFWYVIEASHNISAGSYTTSFSLIRSDHSRDPAS